MPFTLTDTEKQQILDYTNKKGVTDPYLLERLEEPVDFINIAFYYKGKTKRFDRQIFVYLNSTEWISKIQRSKMPIIYIDSRPGTREECIDNHLRFRMKFLIYDTWESLLEDELAETKDQEWVDQLSKYRSKFPLEKRVSKPEQMKLFHVVNPNE